jgi:hypothetical protein
MLSALPGLRDLRAPLAAGYLWLLNLWLITRAYDANTNSLSHAFIQLGELAGTVSLSVAIGFAAYLLGSLTEGVLIFLIAFTTEMRVSNRGEATLDSVVAREMEGREIPSKSHDDLRQEFLRRRRTKSSRLRFQDLEQGARVRGMDGKATLESLFHEALLEDLDLVKTRLLENHKEVFSVSDRLNSEADLRFAVIPPMVLLAGVIAHEAGKPWLFTAFLVPLVLLGIQAWVRKRKGGDVLADALSLRLVEAPAAEDFVLSVKELELTSEMDGGNSEPRALA